MVAGRLGCTYRRAVRFRKTGRGVWEVTEMDVFLQQYATEGINTSGTYGN